MPNVLVDTDVLVDFTRGHQIAAETLEIHGAVAALHVSAVSAMELLCGCANKTEQRKVERLLSRFHVEELGADVGLRARELLRVYSLSHGLRIPDALIAATALENKWRLLTGNVKDFKFIESVRVIPYTRSSAKHGKEKH